MRVTLVWHDKAVADILTSECRLAVYGSLGPGKANHHHVANLDGVWVRGAVRGELVNDGWGAALGFPGLRLDDEGALIDVDLLESFDLPSNWNRLDVFEGPGYQRVVATVETPAGTIEANIYVLSEG